VLDPRVVEIERPARVAAERDHGAGAEAGAEAEARLVVARVGPERHVGGDAGLQHRGGAREAGLAAGVEEHVAEGRVARAPPRARRPRDAEVRARGAEAGAWPERERPEAGRGDAGRAEDRRVMEARAV